MENIFFSMEICTDSQFLIDIYITTEVFQFISSFFSPFDRWVSQMRMLLVACHELTVDYNTLPKVLYVLEDKT